MQRWGTCTCRATEAMLLQNVGLQRCDDEGISCIWMEVICRLNLPTARSEDAHVCLP
jgi:hypothetical protein